MVRSKGADAVDLRDVEKMETDVHWSNRGDGAGDPEDGTESVSASWNRLASIKSTKIGISALNVGLQCCDSAEF